MSKLSSTLLHIESDDEDSDLPIQTLPAAKNISQDRFSSCKISQNIFLLEAEDMDQYSYSHKGRDQHKIIQREQKLT